MAKTALYRMYDSHESLLYVGISENIHVRIDQHKSDKRWFANVHLIEVEWFSTRERAVDAEVIAIKRERPIYNVSSPAKARVRRSTAVPKRVPSSAEEQDLIASGVIEKLGYSIAQLIDAKAEKNANGIGRPTKMPMTDCQIAATIALWHCLKLKRATVIRWVSKFHGQPVKAHWVRDLIIKHTGSAARDANADGKRPIDSN